MKGKNGNLIMVLRENERVELDGPGIVQVKEIKKNKVVVLINANDETNIKRGSKDVIAKQCSTKE